MFAGSLSSRMKRACAAAEKVSRPRRVPARIGAAEPLRGFPRLLPPRRAFTCCDTHGIRYSHALFLLTSLLLLFPSRRRVHVTSRQLGESLYQSRIPSHLIDSRHVSHSGTTRDCARVAARHCLAFLFIHFQHVFIFCT